MNWYHTSNDMSHSKCIFFIYIFIYVFINTYLWIDTTEALTRVIPNIENIYNFCIYIYIYIQIYILMNWYHASNDTSHSKYIKIPGVRNNLFFYPNRVCSWREKTGSSAAKSDFMSYIIGRCNPCSCSESLPAASVYDRVAWLDASFVLFFHLFFLSTSQCLPHFHMRECHNSWICMRTSRVCVCEWVNFPPFTDVHGSPGVCVCVCVSVCLCVCVKQSPTYYDAINLLSVFSRATYGLIYADIIANGVNYLKNPKITKSCMEPLTISQHPCRNTNSAS